MRIPAVLLAAGLLAAAPSLPGATPPDAPAAPGAVLYPKAGAPPPVFAHEGTGGGLGGTVVLVVAVGACAGAWLWWRARRGAPGALSRGGRLSVAETRPLGNRQYLVVADYAGRKFLLGVCPGRIEMLSPLDPDRAP